MSTGKVVMFLAALTVVVNIGLAYMFTSPSHTEVEKVQENQDLPQNDLLSNEVRRSIGKPAELSMNTPPAKEVIEANKELFDTPQSDTTQEEQSYVPGKTLQQIEDTMAKVEEQMSNQNSQQNSEATKSEEEPDLSFNTPMFAKLDKNEEAQNAKAAKEAEEAKKAEEAKRKEELKQQAEKARKEIEAQKAAEAKKAEEAQKTAQAKEEVQVVQVISAKEPEKTEEKTQALEIKAESTAKESVRTSTAKEESRASTSVSSAAGTIKTVDVRYANEMLFVRVSGDKAMKAKTMYVGNPERAILDILGNWKISFTPSFANNPFSTGIRVGVQKEKVRFVIDITTKKFTRRLVQIDSNTVELQVNFN